MNDDPIMRNRPQACFCCDRSFGMNRRAILGAAAGLALASSPVCAGVVRQEQLVEPVLVLPRDQALQRRVALTLDACSGGFDDTMLEALIALRVPATLFVTGIWLAHHGQTLARIRAYPGLFSFGNHGARHQAMVLGDRSVYGQKTVATIEQARQEVMEGARLIEQATGTRPQWFRGATALYSPSLLPMIEVWGFKVAGFSLNADAGASLPAASVAARIARAEAGNVLIAHINQPHRSSGAGVIAGVKRLVDQGFTFTTLEGAVLTPQH